MEIITGFIVTIVVAAGIPSAITAFVFTRLNKQMDKREADRKEREEAKELSDNLLIEMTMASISLAEATAKAVQRIPDAKCNGDMHEALAYATKIKQEYRSFERKQTVKSIN